MVKRLLLIAFLLSLAASSHAWPPLNPAVINGGAAGEPTPLVLWSAWNEAADTTLKTDQNADGADDLNICFYKSGALQNETSRGVLATVETQIGSVPAASGTPPSRALNGTDQGFRVASNALPDTLFAGAAQWVILICADTISGADAGDYFFRYRDNTGGTFCSIIVSADARVQFYLRQASVVKINDEVTSVFNTTGRVYVVFACDGSRILYGWGTTKPTKASDLSWYTTVATTATFPAALNSSSYLMSFFYSTSVGSYLPCNARYRVLANYCFIDLTT